MGSLLKLEDFGALPVKGLQPPSPAAQAQEGNLDAYEDGYRAGWDDAVAAATSDRTQITEDFKKSLQDISFSYHEARTHVLNAIAPLLSAMAEKLLPEMAQEHFAQTVLEAVQSLAENAADQPVEVLVNPDTATALRMILSDDLSVPIEIREESHIGTGQAMLKAAQAEHSVDIASAETSIREALDGFLNAQNEEQKYG